MTRILVVEDEESFSDALSFMLRKEGFAVTVATSGPEALGQFAGIDVTVEDIEALPPILA